MATTLARTAKTKANMQHFQFRSAISTHQDLLSEIISNFELDLVGIHGIDHWLRVAFNGYTLHTLMNEIDVDVTGEWIKQNRKKIFLCDDQIEKLIEACTYHTIEIFSSDITIQACWDADRLDIGRCKPYIDRDFLGTPLAKMPTVMAEAMRRSRDQTTFYVRK